MTWRLGICFSIAAVVTAATITGTADHPGVVVWLESAQAPPADDAPRTVNMAHKNKTFVPHTLAIRTGWTVSFPNQDPFLHNAFSNYDGQPFDIGLHPPGSARQVTFKRPGIVRLFCNIHPTMSAVIVVLDSPWFAVSDEKGAFSINAPPGEYRLRLFYERGLPEVLSALERRLTVEDGTLLLGSIHISETGYIVPPHKNKYGKDYPKIIVDQYPGPGRKQ